VPFHVLCLSGGGYQGLYTAEVLAGIERETRVPLLRQFDLIAGTSIGGIIALGLAAGVPAAEIARVFRQEGSGIFSNRPAPQRAIGRLRELLKSSRRARYRSEPLARVVTRLVGGELKIGDLKQRVMVPAVNMTSGRPQVFKTPHHASFVRDPHLRVVDVALATAAAPTYFPLHRIGGELFADGGLYCNAPDLLALHEAEHFLGWPAAELRMLSIGATSVQFSLAHASGYDWGWFGWMERQRLSRAIIGAQQINTVAMMEHRLGPRYLRIDTMRSAEQAAHLALDVATDDAAQTLLGLAEASLRDHLGRGTLAVFSQHEATQPKFT
jgi:predicted acylesterase/phospholipase RssA